MCIYSYVAMCLYMLRLCLSVGLSVGCLFGCWPVCFSFSQSVCLYLPVCVPLVIWVNLDLSVSQSVSLSICPLSVGRSSVFLSCQSVTVRMKRAGNGRDNAESERAKERQTGLMDAELKNGG